MSVSLLIPAYNAGATIGAALSSALTQSRPFDEIIVVDDGSTDETRDVVASHRGPVQLIRAPHQGVAAARNRAMSAASGTFLTFLDADDILLPGHLASLLAVAPSERQIVAADGYNVSRTGLRPQDTRMRTFPKRDGLRRRLLEENVVPITTMFRRSSVAEVGEFDESLGIAEDWDFWLRWVLLGHEIVPTAAPSWLCRRTEVTTSSDDGRHADALRVVLGRLLDRPELTPDERAYVARRLAGPQPVELIAEGERALLAGDWRQGRDRLGEAAALCPGNGPLRDKARLLRVGGPLAGRVFAQRLRARRS